MLAVAAEGATAPGRCPEAAARRYSPLTLVAVLCPQTSTMAYKQMLLLLIAALVALVLAPAALGGAVPGRHAMAAFRCVHHNHPTRRARPGRKRGQCVLVTQLAQISTAGGASCASACLPCRTAARPSSLPHRGLDPTFARSVTRPLPHTPTPPPYIPPAQRRQGRGAGLAHSCARRVTAPAG